MRKLERPRGQVVCTRSPLSPGGARATVSRDNSDCAPQRGWVVDVLTLLAGGFIMLYRPGKIMLRISVTAALLLLIINS